MISPGWRAPAAVLEVLAHQLRHLASPSVIAITAAAFAASPGASASSTTTTHRVPFVIAAQ